jgi:AraC-like DNA-binding protein
MAGIWVVLYAVGAVQAAMLALALARRAANPLANRVLSAWLALVAADLAIRAVHLAAPDAGLAGAYRFVRLLPFLYAPLFLVYVRALTLARVGWNDLAHCAWFAAALAWALVRWSAGASLSVDAVWQTRWFDPLLFAVGFGYVLAAAAQVRRYRSRVRQRRSDADRLSLRWLVAMAACQCVIWGIALMQWQANLPHVDYHLIYGAVAAWVCVVGWFSLGQPPVAEPVAASPLPEAGAPASAVDPRHEEVEARLSTLMDRERLYREPSLTIAQLARRSGYPEYLVSAVINRRKGGNFWDYVNRHRVEAARACLGDPADDRTILDIAYDVGFTSKSTFNAAFKRLVGDTPSGYRRRHREHGGPRRDAGAGSAASTRTPRG